MKRQTFITKETLFHTDLEDREIDIQIVDIENSELNEMELENHAKLLDKYSNSMINELKENGYTEIVFENGYVTVLKTNDDSECAIVSNKDTSVVCCKL